MPQTSSRRAPRWARARPHAAQSMGPGLCLGSPAQVVEQVIEHGGKPTNTAAESQASSWPSHSDLVIRIAIRIHGAVEPLLGCLDGLVMAQLIVNCCIGDHELHHRLTVITHTYLGDHASDLF